jgi:hypothetical protein
MSDSDDDEWREEFLEDMKRGLEEIRQGELNEQLYKKECSLFVKRLRIKLNVIFSDYYAERTIAPDDHIEGFDEDATRLFNRINRLMRHYIADNKEELYGLLIPVKKEVLYSTREILHDSYYRRSVSEREKYVQCNLVDYIEMFGFYSCVNRVHKYLKKQMFSYYPEIPDLPVNGLYELDNKLFFGAHDSVKRILHHLNSR